jgi:hypothetical protein
MYSKWNKLNLYKFNEFEEKLMKKKYLYFAFLTLLVSLLSFQTYRAQSYNNGGVFDFNWGVSDYKKREAMKTGLINFLRSGWDNRKLSKVRVNFYSLEGDPFYATFYIEPDKRGRWVIVEKWERICCALYSQMKKPKKTIKTSGTKVYNRIELLESRLREAIPF